MHALHSHLLVVCCFSPNFPTEFWILTHYCIMGREKRSTLYSMYATRRHTKLSSSSSLTFSLPGKTRRRRVCVGWEIEERSFCSSIEKRWGRRKGRQKFRSGSLSLSSQFPQTKSQSERSSHEYKILSLLLITPYEQLMPEEFSFTFSLSLLNPMRICVGMQYNTWGDQDAAVSVASERSVRVSNVQRWNESQNILLLVSREVKERKNYCWRLLFSPSSFLSHTLFLLIRVSCVISGIMCFLYTTSGNLINTVREPAVTSPPPPATHFFDSFSETHASNKVPLFAHISAAGKLCKNSMWTVLTGWCSYWLRAIVFRRLLLLFVIPKYHHSMGVQRESLCSHFSHFSCETG